MATKTKPTIDTIACECSATANAQPGRYQYLRRCPTTVGPQGQPDEHFGCRCQDGSRTSRHGVRQAATGCRGVERMKEHG